ncbi:glyoxal oxidase [Pseudonocardia cypriaca]|uniref:Glyoxal oxidase-like protein n=1 Tax=Pseudonocardia cypriaca TaxID=882449 RepID=A0A543GCV6_9PSEU|nr:glyoxal oxidase [Pseudonocardia cypriaca]TQM43912.1 glyoxal oxidase-like protein [Pseudonocardia cypriaca]
MHDHHLRKAQDHDAPDQHERPDHEAPHPHEGPGGPVVDYHVFSTIRSTLRGPVTQGGASRWASAVAVLDEIEQHVVRLDWLIGLSRRAVVGEHDARQLLGQWLGSELAERPIPASNAEGTLAVARATLKEEGRSVSDQEGNLHGHNGPDHGGQDGRDPTLGINVKAIRELFLGAVYVLGPDNADRRLELLQVGLQRSIGLMDSLHHQATRVLQGREHPDSMPNLLNQLPRGRDLDVILKGYPRPPTAPKLPPLPKINPILECLGTLRNGTVGSGSAVSTWINATTDTLNLTQLITRIAPSNVCAGRDIVIHADRSEPAKQFPLPQPADYGVFLEPCGTPAAVREWANDHVTVTVPNGARSGCVIFGRLPAENTGAGVVQAEVAALERFSTCLNSIGVGRPQVGPIALNPRSFCRITVCSPDSPNLITVGHAPDVFSFVARDPAGREIGAAGVEAGTTVTVVWEVRSDAGPLQIATSGAKTLTGQPAIGSVVLSPLDMRTKQTLTLQATNSCGTVSRTVAIPVFRKLYLAPKPLSMMVDGQATLTVRSSCPVTSDLTVAFSAANSDGTAPLRVTVPPTATIRTGQDAATVSVAPALTGGLAAYIASLRPGFAAAVVTATAADHQPGSVGVWVEPPRGQSKVVSPTTTDLVAVHMALLRTGRVLMFSADDTDFGNIDKVKTREWNPVTNSVTTPTFPYPAHKNLFCAGHCLLPDGRVLVVGGHAILAGGSAAKAVHTFDPQTNTWSRHGFMQKDRWYPTCLTLADGRALITSGSEAGGPPTVFKGIVRDVEIFDPAANSLTNFPNIHGDICMYPYMFVLPGESLFFHSRNVSWLFLPGSGTWSPTNGTWSGDIRMQSSSTRTYPGMAGCVLLPLLPEAGYAVRVLMAGGGGAKENDLNPATVATRTAEILDIDVSQNTGTWRNTDRSGAPLLMTTSRFMSDGVLLPDGTVLFVNGAATGKADHSHVSVEFAELFDPETESFRPLTSMTIPRHYHGTALLLPDGRVAVAGHTSDFNEPPVKVNRYEVEIVSPPYLFRGPQPAINGITFIGSTLGYGQALIFSTDRPDDIARVALLRPGSVTHQLNTDQRYIGLRITARSGETLSVTAPPGPGIAPPGDYLIFLVDTRGVPSRGHFVRLR